jgi:hypothetical protein
MIRRLARATTRYRATSVVSVKFTGEEIDVLEALLWKVGGSPAGPRGVLARIKDRIEPYVTPPARRDGRRIEFTGGIYVEEYTREVR